MEHYVTLFDSFFLPQGLALHASMQRHAGDYRLWVLCVDDTARDVLAGLALPNVSLLKLSALETPALLRVKADRSRAEYCWTLTPFAPRFVFEADASVSRVTYVDADLWLCKNPRPIFAEFERAGAQVLITDHGYAPEYDQAHLSGQFCVQFMTFTRRGGEPVRQWWEDRCIEWCYARFEQGKYGDQRYLDDWPTRFEGIVHVLTQQQFTQAPWNATRFPCSQAITYHFQSLRILPGRLIDCCSVYVLPKPALIALYQPYLVDLGAAITRLQAGGFKVKPQAPALGLYGKLRRLFSGVYQQGWRFHRLNFGRY